MKNGLLVTATGRAVGVPDRVSINLGASVVRADPQQALGELNQKIGRLIERLVGLGVERKHLRTADLALWPETDQRGAPGGFRARNTISITLDEVARVGELISAGTEEIGDGVEMNGIHFTIRDEAELASQARAEAYARAEAKARQLAELAGRGLGKVVSVVETAGGINSGGGRMMKVAFDAEAAPVEPGSAVVAVTLTVRFALVG